MSCVSFSVAQAHPREPQLLPGWHPLVLPQHPPFADGMPQHFPAIGHFPE